MAFIGKGSVSNVYLAKNKMNDRPYAMKSMSNNVIKEKNVDQHTQLEKDILIRGDSPFLIHMEYVF